MHPSIGIGLLAVFVALLAAAIWAALRHKANKIAAVRCQPPSDIATHGMASANEKGLVSTEGSLVPGKTLKAPMSGRDCLYWEVEIVRKWEKDRVNAQGETEREQGSTSVITQKQGSFQEITDGQGPSVLVDFTAAPDTDFTDSHSSEVKIGLILPGELKFGAMRLQTPPLPNKDITKGFLGREKIVPPITGDQVYVLGKLQRKPEGLTITKPGWTSLIVSSGGRAATLGKADKQARIASFVSAGFAVCAVACAVVGLVVGRPAAASTEGTSATTADVAATTPAEAAAAPDNTPCGQAYDSIADLVKSMQKSMPGGKTELPDRATFVRGCHELPPQIQKCMVLSYGMEHLEECQQAQKSLDPATADRVKKLMGR